MEPVRFRHVESIPKLVKAVKFEETSLTGTIVSLIPEEEFMKRLNQVRNGTLDHDGTISLGHVFSDVENFIARSRVSTIAKRESELRKLMIDGGLEFGGVGANEIPWLPADGTLSDELNQTIADAAWITHSLSSWMAAGITQVELQSLAGDTAPREGTTELFDLLSTKIIVSYGVADFIDSFLKRHGLTATVIATRLIFDENEQMKPIVGFHPKSIVTPKNKGLVARMMGRKLGLDPRCTIAIGDSIHDVDLMDPEGAINLLIVPKKKQLVFRDSHLPLIAKHVHAVLCSDSFGPLVTMLKRARDQS